MVKNLSKAVHTFPMQISVDVILLPRYMNWSSNFTGLPLKVEMTPCLKHMNSVFIHVHVEANASCYLLPVILKGFNLKR